MGKLGTIIKKDTFMLSAFLISVFNCSARKIFSSFRDGYLIKQRLNNIIKCWFLLLHMQRTLLAGADPGFFLGGGALVSCSTSTPINHIVFFFCRIPVVLENRRSSQWGVRTPCTLPLDPPLTCHTALQY